ncbi:hypothetical protein P153DRAFT_388032 [Dothidotthia symphoricarpi CBS 119687]|uniref:Uncharacterized protein n=1 Tax=Dothidotthia symphoricarpi CBS 119687 TaxID=1392245 RepID=A0A6A6A697_9PLEO|nr:uncharacterized protein P153DRAFT_388032 [Dothidotthia symphoricarpi CBS 119687]KAF2126705.1 hypothetical protein P153DRAFT_388032 [Dothidotthia symphoricarpi CBS 119687]
MAANPFRPYLKLTTDINLAQDYTRSRRGRHKLAQAVILEYHDFIRNEFQPNEATFNAATSTHIPLAIGEDCLPQTVLNCSKARLFITGDSPLTYALNYRIKTTTAGLLAADFCVKNGRGSYQRHDNEDQKAEEQATQICHQNACNNCASIQQHSSISAKALTGFDVAATVFWDDKTLSCLIVLKPLLYPTAQMIPSRPESLVGQETPF